nr:hypothetical protein [Tanacetum cinerariifolium]
MVTEDDVLSKEKEIDKLMALISLSFKKIYKPTNNNLRTSSNTNRANQDNSPRINKGTVYDNQRTVNVVGAWENVVRECQKPKRYKDVAYHKEKMILYKHEGVGFQLNAEQADWRDDTNDELYYQKLEAHYIYMEKVQEVTPDDAENSIPNFDTEPLQKDDDDDLGRERDLLASLIDNLMEYYYADHKNAILELSKSNIMSKSFDALLQHDIDLELALQQYLKAHLQDKGIAISELKKLIENMKGKLVETMIEEPSVIRQPNAFKSQRQPVLVTVQILPQNVKSILNNINVIAPGMYKVHTKPNQTRTLKFPQDIRKTNKRVSFSTEVIPITSVSRPQIKSNRLEDTVMHNNSEGKKQQVEDHHRNFKFSNNKTFVATCNDNLNDKTLNVNFVYVTCGKCVLNDNHDMSIFHYINGMNSRTKMTMAVPISTREPKRTVNRSVATPLRRSTIRKLFEHVSKTCS